ncbi:MAG: hypothetical protein JJ960_18245 [Kordiimonadaceae bacterium]|nr:hypothetical protein [Kordiimonadaceae bacterium]
MKFFALSFAIVIGIFFGTAQPVIAVDCQSMEILPFAGQHNWKVLSDGRQYCVRSGQEYLATGENVPLAVDRLNDASTLVTLRESVSNYLALEFFDVGQTTRRVNLTFDQRSKLHPEATFVFDGTYYLLAYNTTDNLPSGRRRTIPRNVLALHRVIVTDNDAHLEIVDEAFLEVGIEAGVLVTKYDDDGTVLICAQSICRRLILEENGTYTSTDTVSVSENGNALEILETASGGGRAYALAQSTIDDRFAAPAPASSPHFFLCDVSEVPACEGLNPRAVPFNLTVENGKARIDDALVEGIDDLIKFDLTRSGLNGLANLGENNMEGRIAWSQVYYLNGLLSLLDLSIPLGLPDDLREQIDRRFYFEVTSLAKIAETMYPGFLVRRYALDREPYLSLLHNARILKIVWRATPRIPSEVLASFDDVGHNTLATRDAIERFDPAQDDKPAQGFIRKFFPFWADGARVPWNFQSGWIEAVAWAPIQTEVALDMASSMTRDFLKTESLTDGPEKWGYATGVTSKGWRAQDGISANTPDYAGDTANPTGAHISYRSMDALAVLAAMRTSIIERDTDLVEHFASLVKRGLLYPFVNEELRLMDREQKIPFSVSRRYVRSRLPWQWQSQPWAIRASMPSNQ